MAEQTVTIKPAAAPSTGGFAPRMILAPRLRRSSSMSLASIPSTSSTKAPSVSGRRSPKPSSTESRAADGVVGADLSGGLDSSTAVVLAADAGTVHAVTYTAPVLVQLRPGGA
ncbi:asparagine synthase-related protein [Streptomyces sp. NBC_00825]|uniref:asparagine synthase-related protein n=1 Tax=unclassified Streptomyces TaxID=2593676 RepID=UPI002ED62604|nr:asparagine synthase-related protein [Streptomyces sp. NBC_00826]WTH95191.1 asparagine synthase-related protein [Streptomyces sp. NBC_00825]WTI03925.1 asparagine synthase-related protein [Streptomyces sp. NBC_00822]